MKTCKKLGIKTVAVYSEADESALFVKYADEAVLIGPAPSAQSYLSMNAILEACKKTGAMAVHPGYGFLSEKPEFAELLMKNGITFIGPPPEAMRLMSDKLQSKSSAMKAKVNVVPGVFDVIDDVGKAIAIANQIG
ncbi:Propionyl-CoA carboxylase alpha chain, mitochondrial [Thelohanellus kitauei]|uniref:Propionyl-CoA carboxylase alpha chain, mitochondrial n=1 Tax=Thelohanellus kitauei TaxID=669202 RepID=A0A0C2MV45_THEKT|nr:Propionyl-CoA carboxylase alpha chain, mitochondrial [Thelohanellus kitauei]